MNQPDRTKYPAGSSPLSVVVIIALALFVGVPLLFAALGMVGWIIAQLEVAVGGGH